MWRMLMAVALAAVALPPGATSTEEIPIGTILSQWGSYREVATAMQARTIYLNLLCDDSSPQCSPLTMTPMGFAKTVNLSGDVTVSVLYFKINAFEVQ